MLLSKNMQRVIAGAETEYGMPFADVVAGFAADGEGRRATAAILGTNVATLYLICEKLGIIVKWPEPCQTIGWQNKGRNYHSPARTRSMLSNLAIAHRRNEEKFRETRKTTPELMQKAIALHKSGMGWRAVAKELGNVVHFTYLRKCYIKHYRGKELLGAE